MKKILVAVALISGLSACAPQGPKLAQEPPPCHTVQTTLQVNCAVLLGEAYRLGSDGGPVREAGKQGGVRVSYEGRSGPFVSVFNTYPGMTATIRFDDDTRVWTVADGHGVARRGQADLVERMRSASVARVQSYRWPEGGRQYWVDVSGFAAKWDALLAARAGN